MQNITKRAQEFAASYIDGTDGVDVTSVSGGYSRNRRSIVSVNEKHVFVKEVDIDLLPDDGAEELLWLKKDHEVTRSLYGKGFDGVPEWSTLSDDGTVLLLPSYRQEDGWLWGFPDDGQVCEEYVDAVIAATERLACVAFSEEEIGRLNLQPFLRDEIGLDEGLHLIVENNAIREQVQTKLRTMIDSDSRDFVRQDLMQLIGLLDSRDALNELFDATKGLMSQDNSAFGHCDVRSDNLTYHPESRQIRLVDWNWASMTPQHFGSTEFLIDARRRGVNVDKWSVYLNRELLAASVGFWLRRCIKDPLQQGSSLREMQAESAAMAYAMFKTL